MRNICHIKLLVGGARNNYTCRPGVQPGNARRLRRGMLVGHVGRITPEVIGGWAADTKALDAAVDVVIYVDGKRAARVTCDRFREDLRDLGIYGEGRHGFEHQISPPLPLHLIDRVTVRFADSGMILPDGERVMHRDANLGAILVTAPGRSGTTLLMSRLSRSPQICVAEAYPFEVRLISYWSTAVQVLSAGADYERSTHPDGLQGDGFKVGSNPFSHSDYTDAFRTRTLESEYFSTYVPNQLLDVARTAITEYYQRIKDDRQKRCARFLAEKNNNLDRSTRSFAKAMFPDLKEIVLVRDPRDLLCSHVSYFGRAAAEAISQITGACAELMRIRREEPDVLFVKYEDIVLEPGWTDRKLADYLGVEPFCSGEDDAREASEFKVHATSATPAASIGRWASQLSIMQQSQCGESWSHFIAEFGYARSGPQLNGG